MHVFEAFLRKAGGRIFARRLALLAFFLLTGTVAAHAASLDPAVLPKIQAATFEVVAAKPVNDPLTYDKPLPLELLPFQERNDKYYSIGTAFALGNNRYATAAHVLQIGLDSLWGPPELRDVNGHVYAIDKIEKYSLQQDFVVFSLATQPADAAVLAINPRPALNEVVYAVGNALGTGVVIRDGLYTSDTPEDQDGRWKWMRFSAAASPGNSGGPLLDKDGKLIGIVLMKSANENLNYALPINEILKASDHLAVMDSRMSYQLDLFEPIQSGVFKAQFALPVSLADFYRNFQAQFDAYSDAQLKALLAREGTNLFPKGAGSARLLYQQTQLNLFPTLIVRGSNGEWGRAGESTQHFALDGNGYVDVGAVGRNGLVHLRRPDGMAVGKFYGDAKTRMDLLAATGVFQRTFGGENIKITSLGKPVSESVHVDNWQRPWRVEVWPLPYANMFVVAYSLPVPDGVVTVMRMVPASQQHDAKLDLDELSSFMYVSYEGTLAQWKDFLKDSALLPAVFRDIRIAFDYGQRFSYASDRIAFSYTPEVQAIQPDGLMSLGFRFSMDKRGPVWDVGNVDVWKDKASDDQNSIDIQRYVAPPPALDDDMISQWQKLVRGQHPYDGVARYENDLMKIDTVVRAAPSSDKSPDALYTVFYGIEGSHPQAFMKAKLDQLTKNVHVTELTNH